ncbi:dTDP-Rha--alpha-D-GlcNAc-pyrophosphate polyprenol alpha-3-L-rhamnosyltransferase [Pontibacter actiniarum]|uniref:dTDP-Rha--alpha-D-GlcNAc-pyrophosphate polyprenol alpha-3-L-rhamnosyltransferase n=2 Tax=Pontibacter actiniarum TaxID=323450 RepID=A0A1X9YPI2_9BACT|nr:glycosyltransferase family 2 protein [Pontibacter actiniarum]ARS34767.1 dTDP-Rha--alpha-D-GlcNAc-pyrophosphate polyprenol alpha-3-L-rhamnosyltransferase [Pontibacter actiniarum]
MHAAVVILNWNGLRYLHQFLPSVVANSGNCEIIVADNASTDGSIAFLQEHFPQVRLILLPENYGFCEGYNKALQQVEAKYYVLLNSDVDVPPGWTEPVLQLMEQDPEIAVCQPKILAQQHPGFFEYAGAGGGMLDALAYPFCRGRLFETLEEDKGQYNDVQEVFWATGACMFVRADVYRQLGGLEPAFFAHMEEIDFCWRAKNVGYKVMYNGHSQVYHVGGGTLHKSNPRKTYLNFRNGLALLYKNTPSKELLSSMMLRVLLDWVAAFRMVLAGQKKDAQAVLKAHADLIRNRSYWRRRRKEQQPKGNFPHISGVYKGSIVWKYFIQQKRTVKDL